MVIKRTTNKPHLLLEKIVQIQRDAELSDYTFADLLGIDRVTWYTTRKQKRPIGITLLKAVTQTYPELDADVLDFLRCGNHGNSDTIT